MAFSKETPKASTANDPSSENNYATLWVKFAKALIGASAIGGVALHLIGYVYLDTYLSVWGINTELFPKPVDLLIIHGYYALMDRAISVSTLLLNNWKELLVPALFFATYLFLLIQLGKSEKTKKFKKTPRKFPTWVKDAIFSITFTGVVYVTVPVVLILGVALVIVPVTIGYSSGNTNGKNDLATFQHGCTSLKTNKTCITLMKEGKAISYGYLIDSSETHLALFDPKTKQTTIFERGGTLLMADPPKTSKLQGTISINQKVDSQVNPP